jgi:hypothetical protein
MKRTPSMLLLLGMASFNARAADNLLHDMAIQFITDEFVPTLLALAAAALGEPMTWGVISAAALLLLVRRHRSSSRPHRS